MAKRHPKLLANAGIDEKRYDELKAFCLQYRKYKRRAELAHAGIVDRPEGRSGVWHKPDPTGNAAMMLAGNRDAKKAKLIEDCVHAVAEPAVAEWLLCYVTAGLPYYLMFPGPPIGRNQFYRLALWFYIELDRAMG